VLLALSVVGVAGLQAFGTFNSAVALEPASTAVTTTATMTMSSSTASGGSQSAASNASQNNLAALNSPLYFFGAAINGQRASQLNSMAQQTPQANALILLPLALAVALAAAFYLRAAGSRTLRVGEDSD
jgi:hypothetical protein